MLTLPKGIIQVLGQFEAVLSERVWEWAKVLVIGAILAPGERTVAAILRVMGCSDDKQFQNDHRVLNRAKWSSRELSRLLLGVLVRLFVPAKEPVILGIDETIERRRGRQIAARGVYRDPVRSSKEFFVKTNGLRWISMMLLTPIPWAQRVWALPFLTVLAPSERYHQERNMRHKTITDWAWQMLLQVARWMPGRNLVVVADGTYAVLDFLLKVSRSPLVSVITRLRLDACLYDPAPQREAGKKGRPALKGKRQPKLAQRLPDPKTVWQKYTLSWYGGTRREMEIATGTALWYQSPVPPVAIHKANTSHWPCCAPINRQRRSRSWRGLSCAGRSKSPFMRCVLIWGWRPSANGRIWRSCVRLLLCWACFLSSPFLLSDCSMVNRFPFARRPGTPKPCRPFPIRSRSFVSISGPPPVFRCRPEKATPFKFHEPFSIALWIRSLSLLDENQSSETFG